MTTPTKPQKTTAGREGLNKTDKVIALMLRKNGASLDDMIKATGWLRHTTHAELSGLRKKGLTITRTKESGISRYTIAKQTA